MLQAPAVITMTIAATRMHRSLVDFTPGSSDVCVILHISSPAHYSQWRFSMRDNKQINDPEFPRAKQAHATTIPPNAMRVAVRTVFEQYRDLTPQMMDDQ